MPRLADHAQSRREIAFALWLVISERGIEGVTFRAVAEAAGVSIGRLQHYFASKEEMVLEGCRQLVAVADDDHGPDGGATDPAEVRAQLTALVEGQIPADEGRRRGAAVWVAYVSAAVAHPAIAKVVADATAGRVEAIARLLAGIRADDAGAAEPSPRDRADALRLAALSEGAAQRVLVGALSVEDARDLLRQELEDVGAGRGESPGP